MLSKQELRIILLHEFKLGHSVAESIVNINKAWGPNVTSQRTTRRWFAKFRSGDISVEDQDKEGRPSAVDDNKLKEIIAANPRKTCREIAEELDVDFSTIARHLKDMGKIKKLDKWVPHDLDEKQKSRRFSVASSLIMRNNNEPFLHRIVTCDEKWIAYDNRRRSAQWLDRDKAPKHFPKASLHQKKLMVTVWWSMVGLIHFEFLKPGETITSERYCLQIDKMHQKLLKMYPALVNRKVPIILHDNARPHVAVSTLQHLHNIGYEILPHPAYSPDLSPTDFHFFKHLDNFFQGKCFKSNDDAKNAFQEFVESRTSDFYKIGIEKLVSRWQKCIDANGCYFD